MTWNKHSDWIDVPTAEAQLAYCEQDLKNSKEALVWAKKLGNPKWKGFQKQLAILQKDIDDCKEAVNKAKAKLKESRERDK